MFKLISKVRVGKGERGFSLRDGKYHLYKFPVTGSVVEVTELQLNRIKDVYPNLSEYCEIIDSSVIREDPVPNAPEKEEPKKEEVPQLNCKLMIEAIDEMSVEECKKVIKIEKEGQNRVTVIKAAEKRIETIK